MASLIALGPIWPGSADGRSQPEMVASLVLAHSTERMNEFVITENGSWKALVAVLRFGLQLEG